MSEQLNAAPLTREEVATLEDGARIVVTWSGGNGPHEYVAKRQHGKVYAVFVRASCRNTVAPLDFVGAAQPFTVVWRAGA